MAVEQLVVAVVDEMPDLVGGSLQIGCSGFDGMMVGAIETGLVDEIDGEV